MQNGNDEHFPGEQAGRGGRRRRTRGGQGSPGLGRQDSDFAAGTTRGPGAGPCGQEGGHGASGEHASICLPPGATPGRDGESGDNRGRGQGRGGGRGGPGGPGGRGGPGGGRGGRGRGRARRGDVRTATLLLLEQQPMHGYQIMQEIAARTDDSWRPGPGAVYPTIAQLEDEGLITITQVGGQKLATLTEAGHQCVRELPAEAADLFTPTEEGTGGRHDLGKALGDLQTAIQAVATTGSDAQIDAAVEALVDARKSVFLILADEDADTGSVDPGPTN